MKKRFNLANLLFNLLVAVLVSAITGLNPLYAIGISMVIGTALSFVKLPSHSLYAGLQKELWTDILLEKFYPDRSFLQRSRDLSDFVTYNTLNLAEVGADPNVLIDNATYPVPTVQRTDIPHTVALQTLDSENTVVRNVEEMEAAYGKMESVARQHREAIFKKAAQMAAYNWAPAQDNASNFVQQAAGGGTLSFDDIIDLAGRYDDVDAPKEGRILLLSPTHRRQLQKEDKKLYKQIYETGNAFYDFLVFSTSVTPTYSAGVKNAMGAVGDTASIAYLESEVCRAIGDMDMFYTPKDPGERGDIIGFQMRFLARSMRGKYAGAIYTT